ncbi:hypothetical protein QUA45_23025 [Microcoleus sp. Pol12A5]
MNKQWVPIEFRLLVEQTFKPLLAPGVAIVVISLTTRQPRIKSPLNITRLIISIAFSPNSSTVKRKNPSQLARCSPRSLTHNRILTIIQGDR